MVKKNLNSKTIMPIKYGKMNLIEDLMFRVARLRWIKRFLCFTKEERLMEVIHKIVKGSWERKNPNKSGHPNFMVLWLFKHC